MWSNPQFPADLVTFTEDILNGKLHFLCSVRLSLFSNQTTAITSLLSLLMLLLQHKYYDNIIVIK